MFSSAKFSKKLSVTVQTIALPHSKRLQNPPPHQHNKLNPVIPRILTPHSALTHAPTRNGETCSLAHPLSHTRSLTAALLSSTAGESPFSLRERAEIVGLDVGSLVPKLAKFVVFSGAFRFESVRKLGLSVCGGDLN